MMETESASQASEPFMWGEKVPNYPNSYQSMRYKGKWYHEGDCVFLRSGHSLSDIGKLYRLFEENDQRKIRVRWFFRPGEIPQSSLATALERMDPKEVFIGLGSVTGVENDIAVETILRKAIVLCTAKHPHNPLPSLPSLRYLMDAADHFFNKAYDASDKRLKDLAKIPNKPHLGTLQSPLLILCVFQVNDSANKPANKFGSLTIS